MPCKAFQRTSASAKSRYRPVAETNHPYNALRGRFASATLAELLGNILSYLGFGKTHDTGQLATCQPILPTKCLRQKNSLRRRQTPWIPCSEQVLTFIAANDSCFTVLKGYPPFINHSREHLFLFAFGTCQEHTETVMCSINRLESPNIYVIGRKNQTVAYQPVVWDRVLSGMYNLLSFNNA